MLVEELRVPVAARSGQSRKDVFLRVSREKKYSSLCQCGVLVPMQHFRGVHNTFGCVGWLGRMAAVLGTFRGVHSTFSWRYPGAPGASTQRAHAGLRVGHGAHGGSAPRGDSLACAGKGLRWAGKCCIRFPLACAAKGLRWIGKCCINTGDCITVKSLISAGSKLGEQSR